MLPHPTYHRLAPALVVALALAVGCVSPAGRSAAGTLENKYWRLVELRGQPSIPAPGSREPHLQFSADSMRVSGSGGCNRMSGPYTRDGQRLQFGPLVSTKMACADQQMNQQEIDFMTALSSTNKHQVTGDTLVLFRDDERLARLVAVPK